MGVSVAADDPLEPRPPLDSPLELDRERFAVRSPVSGNEVREVEPGAIAIPPESRGEYRPTVPPRVDCPELALRKDRLLAELTLELDRQPDRADVVLVSAQVDSRRR
jgi:hypothetical protein